MQLSAVVITKNEERNIARCLESLKIADEIIVVDNHSTDRTVEIAGKFGARVFANAWQGFGKAKQEGVSHASGKWILSLDADEELTPRLAGEIKDVIGKDDDFTGYRLKRKTMFLGRWIYHCGWYPDYVLRLFQKAKGNFNDAIVHENVILDGRVGKLEGELLHYSYVNLEQYLEKSNRYTTLGAKEAFRQKKKATLFDIIIRPMVAFIKYYISKRGFRDGLEGFILSVLSAIAVMVKYAKLRNMHKMRGRDQDGQTD